MRTRAREISTNENGQQKEPSVDQTVREVIRDPAMGAAANLLFTTPDGKEGAIYLNTEKVLRWSPRGRALITRPNSGLSPKGLGLAISLFALGIAETTLLEDANQ
jgi:hypothetical protein